MRRVRSKSNKKGSQKFPIKTKKTKRGKTFNPKATSPLGKNPIEKSLEAFDKFISAPNIVDSRKFETPSVDKENLVRGQKYLDSVDFEFIRRLLYAGLTDIQVCMILGICIATLFRWKEKNRDKLANMKDFQDEADHQVIRALYQRACGFYVPDIIVTNHKGKVTVTKVMKYYPPSEVACIFWLKNRKRGEWRDAWEFVPPDKDRQIPVILYVNDKRKKEEKK